MQDGNLSEWVKREQAVQWPPAPPFYSSGPDGCCLLFKRCEQQKPEHSHVYFSSNEFSGHAHSQRISPDHCLVCWSFIYDMAQQNQKFGPAKCGYKHGNNVTLELNELRFVYYKIPECYIHRLRDECSPLEAGWLSSLLTLLYTDINKHKLVYRPFF